MKIVIDNTAFDYDTGCRLLKLKHKEAPFESLNEIWDEIQPMTFKEIALFDNIEKRRVGIVCLGLERLVKEVEPELVGSETLKKETTYINREGEVVTEKFDDTYQLYRVDGAKFGTNARGRKSEDCFFVKFKDTSTDREYMCWIDPKSVMRTNRNEAFSETVDPKNISPVDCIAWTFQTNVEIGNIKEIIRQGDCILIKPIDSKRKPLSTPRHLTADEYRKLLVAES